MKTNTTTRDHYNDGFVDMRETSFFGDASIVFSTYDGQAENILTETPNFATSDIVDTYKRLFSVDWVDGEEEKNEYVRAFCDWLIENGCTREELGLEDDAK